LKKIAFLLAAAVLVLASASCAAQPESGNEVALSRASSVGRTAGSDDPSASKIESAIVGKWAYTSHGNTNTIEFTDDGNFSATTYQPVFSSDISADSGWPMEGFPDFSQPKQLDC